MSENNVSAPVFLNPTEKELRETMIVLENKKFKSREDYDLIKQLHEKISLLSRKKQEIEEEQVKHDYLKKQKQANAISKEFLLYYKTWSNELKNKMNQKQANIDHMEKLRNKKNNVHYANKLQLQKSQLQKSYSHTESEIHEFTLNQLIKPGYMSSNKLFNEVALEERQQTLVAAHDLIELRTHDADNENIQYKYKLIQVKQDLKTLASRKRELEECYTMMEENFSTVKTRIATSSFQFNQIYNKLAIEKSAFNTIHKKKERIQDDLQNDASAIKKVKESFHDESGWIAIKFDKLNSEKKNFNEEYSTLLSETKKNPEIEKSKSIVLKFVQSLDQIEILYKDYFKDEKEDGAIAPVSIQAFIENKKKVIVRSLTYSDTLKNTSYFSMLNKKCNQKNENIGEVFNQFRELIDQKVTWLLKNYYQLKSQHTYQLQKFNQFQSEKVKKEDYLKTLQKILDAKQRIREGGMTDSLKDIISLEDLSQLSEYDNVSNEDNRKSSLSPSKNITLKNNKALRHQMKNLYIEDTQESQEGEVVFNEKQGIFRKNEIKQVPIGLLTQKSIKKNTMAKSSNFKSKFHANKDNKSSDSDDPDFERKLLSNSVPKFKHHRASSANSHVSSKMEINMETTEKSLEMNSEESDDETPKPSEQNKFNIKLPYRRESNLYDIKVEASLEGIEPSARSFVKPIKSRYVVGNNIDSSDESEYERLPQNMDKATRLFPDSAEMTHTNSFLVKSVQSVVMLNIRFSDQLLFIEENCSQYMISEKLKDYNKNSKKFFSNLIFKEENIHKCLETTSKIQNCRYLTSQSNADIEYPIYMKNSLKKAEKKANQNVFKMYSDEKEILANFLYDTFPNINEKEKFLWKVFLLDSRLLLHVFTPQDIKNKIVKFKNYAQNRGETDIEHIIYQIIEELFDNFISNFYKLVNFTEDHFSMVNREIQLFNNLRFIRKNRDVEVKEEDDTMKLGSKFANLKSESIAKNDKMGTKIFMIPKELKQGQVHYDHFTSLIGRNFKYGPIEKAKDQQNVEYEINTKQEFEKDNECSYQNVQQKSNAQFSRDSIKTMRTVLKQQKLTNQMESNWSKINDHKKDRSIFIEVNPEDEWVKQKLLKNESFDLNNLSQSQKPRAIKPKGIVPDKKSNDHNHTFVNDITNIQLPEVLNAKNKDYLSHAYLIKSLYRVEDMSKSKYNINFADTKSNIKENCDIQSPTNVNKNPTEASQFMSKCRRSQSNEPYKNKRYTSMNKQNFPNYGEKGEISVNTQSVNYDSNKKNAGHYYTKSYNEIGKKFKHPKKLNITNSSTKNALTQDHPSLSMNRLSNTKELHGEYINRFSLSNQDSNSKRLRRTLIENNTAQKDILNGNSPRENSQKVSKNNQPDMLQRGFNVFEDKEFFMDSHTYLSNIKLLKNKETSIDKFASIERFYAADSKRRHQQLVQKAPIRSKIDLNKYTPKNYLSGVHTNDVKTRNTRGKINMNFTSNLDNYFDQIYKKDHAFNVKTDFLKKQLKPSSSCTSFKIK